MADYAACYGGLPDPNTPWPLFCALAVRTPMYHARTQLSTALGIGAAFGGKEAITRLLPLAWPVKEKRPRFIPNTLAPDFEPEEGEGGA